MSVSKTACHHDLKLFFNIDCASNRNAIKQDIEFMLSNIMDTIVSQPSTHSLEILIEDLIGWLTDTDLNNEKIIEKIAAEDGAAHVVYKDIRSVVKRLTREVSDQKTFSF